MSDINAQKVTDELTRFLKEAFNKAGFSQAVIALSGGVDSATSVALTVGALGKKNVYVLLLPYGNLNQQGTADAKKVIEALTIPQKNVTEIDIKPIADPIFALDQPMDNVRRGNIMARVRMTILFDKAKQLRVLVVGTENKTEHILGYFTRFGDSASDIEPLRNLYKTQVYQLAKFLNIPQKILDKAPTAELWEGQTDEGEFGFTYKEADEILSLHFDEKKSLNEIVVAGYTKVIVDRVLSRISENDFKRYLPIIPE